MTFKTSWIEGASVLTLRPSKQPMQLEIAPPSLFSWNRVATENVLRHIEDMRRYKTKKKKKKEVMQRRGQ